MTIDGVLTFGSLFAGIGGFDLGFERVGMACRWQVEIDERCRQVLARHWPHVKRYGDVNDVGRHNLAAVDLVCGGFPCQDVSVAGRREGLAGERSGLWFEFLRVIAELKPEWAIIENVPGLLSSNGGRDFATILSGLAQCGYWWAYRVLDLQFFGVPQRRRRVFIVASLTRGYPQQVLFERESSPWDLAPGREAGQELARDVAASLRNAGNGARGWTGDNEQGLTIANAFNGYTGGADDNDAQAHHLVAFGGNTSNPIDIATARNAHGSNQYDFESETFIIKGAAIGRKPEAGPQYGEVLEDGSCYTLNSTEVHADSMNLGAYNWQSGGDVRHSFGLPNLQANQVPAVGVRRLTPTECERLQGFPDGFTDGQSDSTRYRQLGNAVGIPHSEWIGKQIVEVTNA